MFGGATSMEQLVPISDVESLNLHSDVTDEPLSPQSLPSIRSLVINPHSSNSTISSIFETLSRTLQCTRDPVVLHHALKLLADLAFHHSNFSPAIFNSVRAHCLATESTRLAAESLATLASIADRDQNLVSEMGEVDDHFFVSLCFSSNVPVRLWLLRNAERFHVRPSLLFSVFWGFTRDPYPYVRKVALDGLVSLSKYELFEDLHVIKGCYCRAVELLQDVEDCVRSAAVRVVCEWGKMLAASTHDGNGKDWSDAVFIQLCSMVRDMSMEVRVEAFDAIGRIGIVSEDLGLQTLSKKVLVSSKAKGSCGQGTAEWFEIPASGAAGAFVHGLEDEFLEVRESACRSLRMVTVCSARFLSGALNLLMGMLNEDSMDVKLQALETMNHMVNCEHLKVQDMHTFIRTLMDNSAVVRSAARRILTSLNFSDIALFKLSIDGLLHNLEMYPEDEADVFNVLFHIGRRHGNFVVHIIKEVSEEIEPASDGKLDFDSARVAAFLVLAISASLSHEQKFCFISPTIFSYAVTLLGRISCALTDIMNINTLLVHLCQCSRSSNYSGADFEGKDLILSVATGGVPNYASSHISGPLGMPPQQIGHESGDHSHTWQGPREMATPYVGYQLEEHDAIRRSVNLIFAKVKGIWSLVQLGFTNEVLRTMRILKGEVMKFPSDSGVSTGLLAFTFHYLRVVKLLAKLWRHFVPTKLKSYGAGEMELLLGKLDRRLTEMRCRFIGLSKEEEMHVLELILVTCLVRLSEVRNCHYLATINKLSTAMSHVEFLLKEGSIELSRFLAELQKSLHTIGTSTDFCSCEPFLFKKLVDSFCIQQLELSGNIRHMYAELNIPDNNSENPLPFVSGLPVAIPLEISLHNILGDSRLWLRITMSEDSFQFVYLDLDLFRGCDKVRKCTFMAPFYRTPKVVSFNLRICLTAECLFDDVHTVKGCRGPRHSLTNLSEEKEVHFSVVDRE